MVHGQWSMDYGQLTMVRISSELKTRRPRPVPVNQGPLTA
jgi:hypothetical protein